MTQIPLVFLYSSDADILIQEFQSNPQIQVTLAESVLDNGTLVKLSIHKKNKEQVLNGFFSFLVL